MRGRLLLAGLASVLTIVLAWLLRGFVREMVVVPLLYAAWMLRQLAGVLPQVLFWIAFLLIAVFLAGRSLIRERQPAQEDTASDGRGRGRVEVWRRQIELASRDSYASWRLARRVSELATEALSYDRRLTAAEIRKHLKSEDLDAPRQVHAYLKAAFSAQSYRSFAALEERSRGLSDAGLEQVVEFLETQLEVSRERRRR